VKCRPGDLAIITAIPKGCLSAIPLLGKIVRCLRLDTHKPETWVMEEGIPVEVIGLSVVLLTHIEDVYLTPIECGRDPVDTPIETNVPEALQLALGIESRSYA
jgi:hypothetical protein